MIVLRPYAGEPQLSDPACTGEWSAAFIDMPPQSPPWCNYVAVRDDGTLVGSGGFKRAPDATGAVELGYITFLDARGMGVATAIAAALVDIAKANGASRVIAHTLPQQSASTGVLVANGFRPVGDVVDPDDGPVWQWERVLSAGER